MNSKTTNMKTSINKTTFLRILVLFSMIAGFLYTSSCKKDSPGGGSTQNSAIKTYSGAVRITTGPNVSNDLIDLSFTNGSSKEGTFFRKSDGVVGLFSGNTAGGILSINGSIKDIPNSAFSGTIKIINDSLAINITGTYNSESYTCIGTLSLQKCINLAGAYAVQESVTYTATMGGQTDTTHESGEGYVNLNQTECHVSYDVPNTSVTREGDIEGNKLVLSGPFVIPASSDVNMTSNTFKATVIIIDNYHFEYTGIGKATGTYMGATFVIKGTSSGVFNRAAKSTVASSSGGSSWWPAGQKNAGEGQDIGSHKAESTDLNTLITKSIGTSSSPRKFPWTLHGIAH